MAVLFERVRDALADRYAVERELGSGGMATVYLAQDMKHERQVAVKVLHPELATALGAERFLREIRITARLQHPHILTLIDSGTADGFLYYVMPFVEGESLRDRLRRERQLPVDEALRLIREVADALSYAHSCDVVHRDIKPENILLSGDHAIVLDFGVARAISAAGGETITATGLAIGTPAYMSPEQVAGSGDIDGRSDIYSLGCMFYELLAGEPPFTGATPDSVIRKHLGAPAPNVTLVRPAIPLEVGEAVERAMAKTPADRFSTASQLLEALPLPSAISTPGRGVRAGPRKELRALAAAGILVLALLVVQLGRRPLTGLLGGGGSAPGARPDRSWILVAEFEGPADDPSVARVARQQVEAAINQSQIVATFPIEQLRAALDLAVKPETTTVDLELARELAVRSAVRAIVDGRVTQLGEGYSVVVSVVDAQDGRPLLSFSDIAASAAEYPNVVDDIARQLRDSLGAYADQVQSAAPFIRVKTSSFEAWEKYIQGLRLQGEGDYDGSMVLLREAIALDSDFALAWAHVGVGFLLDFNPDSATTAFRAALRFGDRLADDEKRSLEALTAWLVRYDLPEALRTCDLLMGQGPTDMVSLACSVILSAVGEYERALEAAEQAAARSPFGPTQLQLSWQVNLLMALGRLEEARRVAEQLTREERRVADFLLAAASNDWVAADSLAQPLMTDPTVPLLWQSRAALTRVSALAARGALSEAGLILFGAHPRAAALGHIAGTHFINRAQLLLAVASERNVGQLELGAVRGTGASALITRGVRAAYVGDLRAAYQYRNALEARDSVELRRVGNGVKLLEAWILRQRGEWQAVVDLLGNAALAGEHDPLLIERAGSLEIRWLVADAYEQLEQLDSAAAYFELVVPPTRLPPSEMALRGIPYTFAHARLARLYDRLGRPEEAAQHWTIVAETLTAPDLDVDPLLTEARQFLSERAGAGA